MTDEPRNNPAQPAMPMAGIGLAIHRNCMGCHRSVAPLGGSGVGVRWRCVNCLAARLARAQPQSNVKEEA